MIRASFKVGWDSWTTAWEHTIILAVTNKVEQIQLYSLGDQSKGEKNQRVNFGRDCLF